MAKLAQKPTIENINIDIANVGEEFKNWGLVNAFLQARAETFVDGMKWELFVHDGIEFEQYDTFNSTYVIAHQKGDVVGGARLIQTTSRSGIYTYMIKDAHFGSLPPIPADLCFEEPPVDDKIWELTRFFVKPGFDVAQDILNRSNEYLKLKGAQKCLFLASPAFMRIARSMKFNPERLGPVVSNHDGKFLAFSCDVV